MTIVALHHKRVKKNWPQKSAPAVVRERVGVTVTRYCRSVIKSAEWVLQNAVVTSIPNTRREEDTSTSFQRPTEGAGAEKAIPILRFCARCIKANRRCRGMASTTRSNKPGMERRISRLTTTPKKTNKVI